MTEAIIVHGIDPDGRRWRFIVGGSLDDRNPGHLHVVLSDDTSYAGADVEPDQALAIADALRSGARRLVADSPHAFVRQPGTGMNFCGVPLCWRTIAEHDPWVQERA